MPVGRRLLHLARAEAPGLFSTITGTLSVSPMRCAIARAWMSVCPPAANGTMMRIVLPGIGNCWA
jgi:hypothetical protein